MCEYLDRDERVGAFVGRVSGRFRSGDMLEWLERIPALINTPDAVELSGGRNRNVKLAAVCAGKAVDVVVKAFGKPGLVKNAIDRSWRGSKARRTWLASVHLDQAGVGTPQPVAFLERWVERRLIESYVVTVYQAETTDFTRELGRLFRKDYDCAKFMDLMQVVAEAVRAMHDCGFVHNDLGNQNVMLRQNDEGGGWSDVQFLDLNRGRIRNELSDRERARDISRIYLPSDLLRVFREMYWGRVPPRGFMKWERHYRQRYARHTRSRRWRHPIREARKLRDPRHKSEYPAEKDMWIWDERSGQAQTVLQSHDRKRYYPRARLWNMLGAVVRGIGPVWRIYRSLLKTAYSRPVDIHGRIGVAVEALDGRLERQLELLAKLGPVPVMVRIYHHRGDAGREVAFDAVRRLHDAGHRVSIALMQDRRAVRNRGAWQVWVGEVLEAVGGLVDLVEIGHAINRVKWGIWGFDEYQRLVEGVAVHCHKYPEVTFCGPAVIDFEYPYVLAALDRLPENFNFGALSHHLYVDRRGAPENRQGRFGSLEKFALGRAIARWSPRCDDRFIVSEVNWPLEGTGVYSPVGSPYVSPGVRHNDPSVSEDDYADYMLRYLLIGICSGFVERVYWWRLAAYGYGLVDDSDADCWRPRPAFEMLVRFLRWVGNTHFVEHAEQNGVELFTFERLGERQKNNAVSSAGMVWVAYAPGGRELDLPLPNNVRYVEDARGSSLSIVNGCVKIGARPVCMW